MNYGLNENIAHSLWEIHDTCLKQCSITHLVFNL